MVYKKNSRKRTGTGKPSKRLVRAVKSIVDKRAEHKWNEAGVASLSFDTTPAAASTVKSLDNDLLGLIAQGTSADSRIGDRIRLMSLEFNAVFIPTTATVGAVRLVLGQCIDEQSSSAVTMRYDNVFGNLTGASDFSCITSGYAHEPLFKYKILSDDVITWDATNAAAPRLIHKRFTRLPVKNRNYTTGSPFATGQFFYMLLSANGVAATLVRPYAKVVYTDL